LCLLRLFAAINPNSVFPISPVSKFLLAAFCLLAVTAAGAALEAGDLPTGWKELSLLNTSEAQTVFANAAQAAPASREARLGGALALLQLRSRIAGNIASAREQLEALRRENSGDDSGIAAAYYLARIQQVHSFTPDRAVAVAGYRALRTAHPGHVYAQLAAPKLALLLLYDEVPPDEWERRVAEVQAMIVRLDAPEAVRDTRLILATALIRLRRDHARAYPLITACLEAGSITRKPRLNALLLQAAESAHQLGREAESAEWYGRFLAEFPHDTKADENHRRLAQRSPEARP